MIFWWGMETTFLKYILKDPALKLFALTQREQWLELTTYFRKFMHAHNLSMYAHCNSSSH